MAIAWIGHRGASHDVKVHAKNVESWPGEADIFQKFDKFDGAAPVFSPSQTSQGDLQQNFIGDALRKEVDATQPLSKQLHLLSSTCLILCRYKKHMNLINYGRYNQYT